MTQPADSAAAEWEWINEAEERYRRFLIVCTGGGAHAGDETTLAAFQVSPRWGVLAPVPGPNHMLRGEFARHSPKASYGVLADKAGDVAARWFHCRRCDTPYQLPETAFQLFIEMLEAEAGGDLGGRRVDLSLKPARLQ
jgi:hypothetical protein